MSLRCSRHGKQQIWFSLKPKLTAVRYQLISSTTMPKRLLWGQFSSKMTERQLLSTSSALYIMKTHWHLAPTHSAIESSSPNIQLTWLNHQTVHNHNSRVLWQPKKYYCTVPWKSIVYNNRKPKNVLDSRVFAHTSLLRRGLLFLSVWPCRKKSHYLRCESIRAQVLF